VRYSKISHPMTDTGQGETWRLYLRRVRSFLNVRHWTALVARQLRTKPGTFPGLLGDADFRS
jgi:hypothetical protein